MKAVLPAFIGYNIVIFFYAVLRMCGFYKLHKKTNYEVKQIT